MKKLLYILLILVCGLTAYSALQINGVNGVSGTVNAGPNNVYPGLQIANNNETIVTASVVYDPISGDDVSPPIYVILQQKIGKTNGVHTLGPILKKSIVGTGWMGEQLSANVNLFWMTNSAGELIACYVSDATRTYSGWVYQQIEVP